MVNVDSEGNVSDTKFHFVTNQTVLMVTTVLFALFVVAEVIGALAGNSLSLLGDAAAMSVDVFTYCTNMYAERIKSSGREIDEKTRMMLEVYIPTFSVLALLGITAWITAGAIDVIIDKGKAAEGGNVNILFLYGFSSANFIVDIVSTAFFVIRGEDAFHHSDVMHRDTQESVLSDDGVASEVIEVVGDQDHKTVKTTTNASTTNKDILNVTNDLETNLTNNSQQDEQNDTTESEKLILKKRLNLNMCSALTHLGGDTMRTVSVFIAAVVASTTTVSGNLCDAWAAIIVTLTIVILVVPLIFHIYKAWLHRGEAILDERRENAV